ncbi:hypothetical protein [Acaryochloris marina]|uniref:Uncharacterized protein n=1 Tax=Acaryochloris marina (strain MBIC 11017) TaxID=329726 RepID=B0C103_ACAM1|nr:hypothetical protein [Acaryochloris marina]ABW27262.1 hypothetical protein AM1_2249 [Acaryochloris marina MBIC11017]BDM82010.1 hypothetical protein AM10699_48740 [Acaryochloris marina MBIC10699]
MDACRLVACSFHDELEAWATLRQDCQIIYRDEKGQNQTVNSKIIDVYAANQADFIKLQDGSIIRLDYLISVNDKPIQFANSPFSCS